MKIHFYFIYTILLFTVGCSKVKNDVDEALPKTGNPTIADSTNSFEFTNRSLETNNLDISITKTNMGVKIEGETDNYVSGGTTSGAFLKIEDDSLFSGKDISVSIVIGEYSAERMLVSYSTNEVGNSGWKEIKMMPDNSTYMFNYSVPKMNVGNNDFIGFLPVGGFIEIKRLDIIVDDFSNLQ